MNDSMARSHRIKTVVRESLERNGLIGTCLVVAVSGGPDSTCLLHCLYDIRLDLNLTLHVAHFDHNHRGEEAEEDARFVVQLAQGLDLPYTIDRADPQAHQKRHRISSYEEASREIRYEFLARVGREVGAKTIAVGHTADDQAETVLMHVMRGSGTDGLKGMADLSSWHSSSRRISSTMLFRPLLMIRKWETQAYCQTSGIPFRNDTSNLDLRFSRNWVRHHLMPSIRERNPRIVEALTRLAYLASEEVGYMEREVKESWGRVAIEWNGGVELDKISLDSLHPAIQRRVLRKAYARLAGDTRGLGQVHLNAMAKLIKAPPEKMTCLPRGLKLVSGYTKLLLTIDGGGPGCLMALEGEHPLDSPKPGETLTRKLPGWQVVLHRVSNVENLRRRDPFTAYVDLNRVGQSLWVRRRIPGDRFQPAGMEAEKKLQDFFVDRKVPRYSRDAVPLVVSELGVAWVVGHRVAEWARPVEGSLELLCVEFRREE